MASQQLDAKKIQSPRGVASWPRLADPDTKFKAEGEYSIKLRLRGAQAAELVSVIDAYHDEAAEFFADDLKEAKAKEKNPKKRAEIPERADPPYKELYENDAPTGEWEFNFKMKASGISKKTGKAWTRKPAVFDSKARPLQGEALAKVGGGSVVKVTGELRPFYTAALGIGVSLALEAVQVIESKTFGDRSAANYGFGDEGDDEGAEEGGDDSAPPSAEVQKNTDF